MKKLLPLLLVLVTSLIQAQPQVPTDYFRKPLDIDLVLSGTFGELRSNHFHSGMDIKTQQREGLPVLAAADGHISRINIQHYGYGKALYILHSNGYTTVYGHLQRLSPELEAYLKKQQYAKETYEIELFPKEGELAVKKGDLIAYSGNTGGSGGPHLHFEIRDGQQRPMNPNLFGINLKDTQAPTVNSLFVYPLGENAHVNGSAERQQIKLIPLSDGSFKTQELEACGEIGFGISTVDKLDGAPNNNGVYKIEANLNGDRIFQLNMDKFSFSETRYINSLIDYEYFSNRKSRITKLFVPQNNPLSIYENVLNKGNISVQDSLTYLYSIKVLDYAGNERVIRIPILGKQPKTAVSKNIQETDYFVKADEAFSTEQNGIDIYIPKNSLYEDTYLDISFKGDTLHFHQDDTPIHSNITIGFDVSKYKAEDREKLFIAELGYRGRPSYSSTYKKGNRFTTGTRSFGDYTLVADINAPKISPVNFKDGQWISNNQTLQVKISDDLSGIKSYRATVNGKFILMEYEYKKNMLTHSFSDEALTETENHLKVIVTDNVGNSQTYEATFFRK
ncbi:M23 family metallopeptidase [Gillisia sp. M10.2A]|uniref:M23 family metallopeptidase n=1 Tax=Gillisia lutea TaxID=2909668 RepID=A0ABS9EIV7_9FLAO|nr:M23 family metallopeptidase [Gillisia lutea]MCF4102797.1 M23 family metallopeptidase [Gillisia lutea]